MTERVRIVVAEDQPKLRQSLKVILESDETIDLLGSAEDGERAVQLAMQFEPDIVLTDIQMPRLSGIEVTRRVVRALPNVRVIVWTVHSDDRNVFEALKAGAKGYLLKDSTPQEILECIRSVMEGGAVLDPAIAVRVLEEFQRMQSEVDSSGNLLYDLTARELAILRLIVEGKRNKEIAEELFIAEKTVKNYISNILFKLQVNSRTEAALLAVRKGLV